MRRDLYATPIPKKKNQHFFGIELEFSLPVKKKEYEFGWLIEDREEDKTIKNLIKKYKLQKYITIGHDSDAEDYCEAYELKLLVSEEEMPLVVETTIAMLKEGKARVNSSCGFHVHVDTRLRDRAKTFDNLRKCQHLLYKMAHPERSDNTYCAFQEYPFELVNHAQEKDNPPYEICKEGCELCTRIGYQGSWDITQRYVGVNLTDKYNTVEVRLHEGTLHAKDIIRWCNLLSRIADAPEIKTEIEHAYQLAKHIPLSIADRKYISNKIRKHHKNEDRNIGVSYARL